MSKQKAIEKLRKLCDSNTLMVECQVNRVFQDSQYFKLSTSTTNMSDKEILKAIKICRKHSINFHFYDDMIAWAHNESLNATF